MVFFCGQLLVFNAASLTQPSSMVLYFFGLVDSIVFPDIEVLQILIMHNLLFPGVMMAHLHQRLRGVGLEGETRGKRKRQQWMKAGSRLAQPKSKCAKEIGKVKPPTYGQMQQQQQQQL